MRKILKGKPGNTHESRDKKQKNNFNPNVKIIYKVEIVNREHEDTVVISLTDEDLAWNLTDTISRMLNKSCDINVSTQHEPNE